jgi:hypothetical protein
VRPSIGNSFPTVGDPRRALPSRRLTFAVAFAVAAHLGVVAPFTVYRSNRTAFGVEPGELLPWMLTATIVIAVVLSALLMVARRSPMVFALLIALFMYVYVQFYVLVWDYGVLDGSAIRWGRYTIQVAIEIACLIALIAVAVLRRETMLHFGTRLAVGALVTQALALVVLWRVGPSSSLDYGPSKATLSSIDDFSRERNVVIVLIDSLQGDFLEKLVEEKQEIASGLDGFTVFKNSSGAFPYTRLSVPAVLSGKPYESGEKIAAYMSEAAEDSLDVAMGRAGFRTSQLTLASRPEYLSSKGAKLRATTRVFDVAIFRQSPHVLKPRVLNDYRFLLGSRSARTPAARIPATDAEIDLAVTRAITRRARVDDGGPTYKFIHLHGAHVPPQMDTRCRVRSVRPNQTGYEEQAECALHQSFRYLERLRELGVYDDSLIVVMGDHGSQFGLADARSKGQHVPEFVMSSAHPAIAIKDIGSTGPVAFSDAPASLLDVYPTILEHLRIARSDLGFDLLADPVPEDRRRRFVFFKGAGDAAFDELPEVQEYFIIGDVRDQRSWHVGRRRAAGEQQTMTLVDFGDTEYSQFQDLGWLRGKRGGTTQWTRTPSASLIGRLPDGDRLTVTMRVRTPWKGQRIEVLLNGRHLAEWQPSADVYPGWLEFSSEINVMSTDRDGPSRLEFRIARSAPLPGDSRPVGINVDWVRIGPIS